MIYLLGSIVFTSWLTLAFKVVEKFRVQRFPAIVFNYIFCAITGIIINGRVPDYRANIDKDWFAWACIMGTVFIVLYNIIASSAQRVGVAVTSVANKLSLVIPFVFSIYLYNEEATWLKIIGIAVALLAVILTCLPSGNQQLHTKDRWVYLLPILLFFGSGLLDTMIKYVEHNFLNATNVNEYLTTAFTTAAVIGILMLTVQLLTGKQRFSWKAVMAGVLIGIPNYISIWCLMEVLKQYAGDSSAIIPINNMGIVLFSAVVAWLIFKEKLSHINWIGIILSLGAIALIAFG
ncbi:MAG TPA: DMT family transporter [Chitinophagaceae bacterium]|nr:DMT family transporter [Chitinophagaceae bacterium]